MKIPFSPPDITETEIFLCINKNQLCPDMTHHRCTCGIGISASDHFIAFVDSQKTKCHFRTSQYHTACDRRLHEKLL